MLMTMDTTAPSCTTAAGQHDAQPAYAVLGRRLAVTGLILFLPALALLGLTDITKQVSHDSCAYQGCTKPLMETLHLSWRVMWIAGATGVVAAVLPRRVAALRFGVACLHLALLLAPFFMLSGV
ncbi:hypothetical protein VR41_12505 [Streptomyces sp. NRRL B-1568]|nr:hypothetical protein VR41_12505 [Streptomyces sp. NRRL B-1568]